MRSPRSHDPWDLSAWISATLEAQERLQATAARLAEPGTREKAVEVLTAHFGERHWDPRMRLRLADVLLQAGKDEEAVPILAGLADDLTREGFTEKAIAILKKIEKIQSRHIEEVRLAPLERPEGEIPEGEEPTVVTQQPPVRPAAAAHDPLCAGARALYQTLVREIKASQPSRRVPKVETLGPQATDLAHHQRPGNALAQRQRLLHGADQQDVSCACRECVCRRGERSNHIDHDDHI